MIAGDVTPPLGLGVNVCGRLPEGGMDGRCTKGCPSGCITRQILGVLGQPQQRVAGPTVRHSAAGRRGESEAPRLSQSSPLSVHPQIGDQL